MFLPRPLIRVREARQPPSGYGEQARLNPHRQGSRGQGSGLWHTQDGTTNLLRLGDRGRQPPFNMREPLMHGPGSERRAALTLRQMEARTAEVRTAAAPSKYSRGKCSHRK